MSKIYRGILVVDDEPFYLLGLSIILSQCEVKEILSYVDTAKVDN